MIKPTDRTKANLYGIKGMHNVHSWQGLAIHFKNSSRVSKCSGYGSCTSDKRSRACFYSIRRLDAIYMLQSEFNVTVSIAERQIDTLLDMGITHSLRCAVAGDSSFDDATRILVFDEDL